MAHDDYSGMKHFRVSGTLRARLDDAGVQAAAVLRRANLPQDFFDQTRILVNTEELFALWNAIGEVSKDPCIGVKLGTRVKIGRFTAIGLAALSAQSLRDAVEYIARYKKLTAPEEVLQETGTGEWSLQFRWTLAAATEPPALIDFCFAWLLAVARCGTERRICPLRVELVRARADLKALEKHFGCSVVCRAARNALVFRPEDADTPFITHNDEILEMLAPQFEAETKRRYANRESDFVELVLSAIQRKLTGRRPSIEEIARDLHMSSRTLQRRLQDSGSSYHRALDEARRRLTRHYFSNPVLDLNETAYLLGYADANSFARAFRSWEGMSPRQWQEKLEEAQLLR
jgi:AraC-like DNA-binding protein